MFKWSPDFDTAASEYTKAGKCHIFTFVRISDLSTVICNLM